MVMSASRRDSKRDRLAEELRGLKDQIAGLESEVKALTQVRDSTAERNKLLDEIERLKREQARLVEANDRKIRETEHKTGLLKTKLDQDVAHARRQAVLEVREENLAADKTRFKEEMDFQRQQLQGEVDRIDGVLRAILERLPVIDVELTGAAGTRRKAGRGD